MKAIVTFILLFNLQGFSQTYSFKDTPDNNIVTPILKPQPNKLSKTLFSSQNSFIENVGQYGQKMPGYSNMGKIKYGFEGFGMPVFFTSKGLIYLQRKVQKISEKEERRLEGKGMPEEELERKRNVTDKVITMEWLGANPNCEILAESITQDYYTYGLIKEKARAFKKIIYKDLYPGIDVVYHFVNLDTVGFEYSIIVKPGADLSLIKMKYNGDVKRIETDNNGNLIIRSAIDEIKETAPVSFSNLTHDLLLSFNKQKPQQVYPSSFKIKNNTVSFAVASYDKTKILVIDPFVSGTANLTGNSAGKAKDIDFDYDGNIYVAGGGGGGALPCKLAKFDANGILLWTFNGSITTPSWIFGTTYGGWVVEKTTGNIFLGQGVGIPNGSQNIRLNTAGIYDNFLTPADPDFTENWKMIWNCNNGSPQILIAGGGANSNNNLAICSPPSTTITGVNITGNTAFNQDISDIVFDPVTNEMYTIYASLILPPVVNNRIFKHTPPYGITDINWQSPSGYNSLIELDNRPYLAGNTFGSFENSTNCLAVNSSYLFYWDGLNLKAFNKSNGTTAGSPLILIPNTVLMQGGIIADECNNVFIGNTNGIIKVYKFNGINFDDAAANDITITGFANASVYDLAYDPGKQLLYASGNGFVASFDISSYCAATSFSLSVIPDCINLTAQATVSPAPPSGVAVTYILFSGTTQIASNTTGLFTGLTAGGAYTVKAFINQACGGIQLITNFTLSNCPLTVSATFINPSCSLPNGSITAVASFGTVPYQFSKDGIIFQPTGIFTGLAANNYTITVRDAVNATATVNVTLSNALLLQVTASSNAATCNLNNATITATGTGGTAPLQYSINGIIFQISNIFMGLTANNYTVTVKDANNCLSTTIINVGTIPPPQLSATSSATNCNNNSGIITASASAGTSPYQYSITGTLFQSSNIFNGLATNNYTVTVKDASGCIAIFPVAVGLTNTLTVNAGNNISICEGTKKILTATSNAASFLWTPGTGLSNPAILNPEAAPTITTNYTLTATDGICSNSSIVTVFVDAAPVANAGKDSGFCFGKDIQLSGSGGVSYSWSPDTYLNNTAIYNPVIVKPATGIITYALSVTDAKGCKSLNNDLIVINVSPPPKLFAGNDTAIVINQPLQLFGIDVNNSGFINYAWSPAYGLNNPLLANPITFLDRDIIYTVNAQNINGCVGTDDIKITVFKGPEIYVPTAFTPNADGINDILKAIPVGMKAFNYFTVINRYGQQVFTTADPNKGWDGQFKNSKQPLGTFIWMAEAVDFKGNLIQRKGYVVLIR